MSFLSIESENLGYRSAFVLGLASIASSRCRSDEESDNKVSARSLSRGEESSPASELVQPLVQRVSGFDVSRSVDRLRTTGAQAGRLSYASSRLPARSDSRVDLECKKQGAGLRRAA